MLPHRSLPFSGAEIDCSALNVDEKDFGAALHRTVEDMKGMDKQAVFLKIGMTHSHYIPAAGLQGFRYHHAEGDVATLMRWLPEARGLECKVPPFGTHMAGVAGAIVRDGQLLVVREKSKMNNWKLPGGYVDLNEDLSTAAVREVREELSIDTTFRSLLAFRNQHKVQWGRDDIYAVCRLDMVDPSQEVVIDEEIDDAAWMDIGAFKEQNKNKMLDYVADLLESNHPGLMESKLESTVPNRRPYMFYHPVSCSN